MELCQDKSIKVIYETIPLNLYSKMHIKGSVISEYQSYVNNLLNDYSYLISSGEITYLNDSLYDDAHHMNSNGAFIYTKQLRGYYDYIFK